AFGLLYFLIVLSVESVSQLSHMLFVLVISLAVGDTFAFLQLKGWFLFPFAQNTLFNTIGNPNSVALLSAVALPMALVFSVVFRGWKLWVSRLAAFVLFLFLSFTTFSSALIALSVGLLILLVFGMMSWRKRVSLGWVALPMALLAVTLFLLVFRTPLPGAPSIPPEVSPSFAGEMEIVKQVFRESPILGTGPGTFVFDYAKYHDPQLNATVFWGTRFSSGASEVLDMLMTRGAVGLLALLGLVLSALFFAFRGLVSRSQEGSGWMVGLAVFASFGVSVTGLLVYPSNFVLWFVFWVLLGSLVAVTGTRVQRFAIPASSPLTMVSSLAFLLTLIFGLGVIFVGAQKYTAEVRYLQGVQASNAGDLDTAIEKIVESANLSPSNDQYWRDLSQLYLSKLSQLSADTELSPDERDKLIQAVVGSALTSANRATLVSPNNVANWNVRGFVYRALPGGESLAAESYKRASELEPASPFSFGELARAYMVQAQRVNVQEEGGIEARESAYQLALDQLAKALELKSDYSTAHFLI
ncbi:MAG: hypothetical protein U1C72_00775, partial [Candidatus Pacearchaeota archaeon]|nr:hypothetical protein [Candidatus Pacearchaeota archaeon]